MNIDIPFLARAYINLPETYDEAKHYFQNLDLLDLILAVAKANPNGDGSNLLYDINTNMFYERRTKEFIVRKTKAFILGMPERFNPDENMANFVSLRQLKNLIKAFKHDKKRISCYGLIYLYVIYTLLQDKSSKANECQTFITALYILIGDYFENFPNDQLAEFFYECYNPIFKAINSKNTNLQNNQLPSIPRKHPREDE